MAKRKPKTLAKLRKEAAVLFQKLRRMEDADDQGYCTCVSCGVVKKYNEMDGGHWISRGHVRYLLEPWNVNAQCKRCNRFSELSIVSYYETMIDRHGIDQVEKWVRQRNYAFVHVRPELEAKIADYKQRIKQQEERLGIS